MKNETERAIAVVDETTVALKEDTTNVTDQAKALVVKTQATYDVGHTLGTAIKLLINRIHKSQDPICRDTDQAHKTATAARKELLAEPERAMHLVASKMNKWFREQVAKREAAERKEQERLDNLAEEKRQKDADKLREQGLYDTAKEVEDEPVLAPSAAESPKVKKYEVEKPKGVSHPEVWTFDMVNKDKLSRAYLMPDLVRIGKLVRAIHKDAEATVGQGAIRVYDKGSTRGFGK